MCLEYLIKMERENILNDGGGHYPFVLVPLPYAYDALEPFIDSKTMELHHDRHLATYVNNLNAALKDYPELHDWSLEQLLYFADYLTEDIRTAVINNGGGVYNHNLFFAMMRARETDNDNGRQVAAPTGELLMAINNQFGSFDKFKEEFKKDALSVFGSGYTWLAVDGNGQLHMVNTKNQDTVLPLNLLPVMLIDVWEHAYYLKHYNVRADYIDAWFNVVDMDMAEDNYVRGLSRG